MTTTRRAPRSRGRSRSPRPTMTWWNNAIDPQSLAPNTTAVSQLTLLAPPFPDGYQSGFTILRLIVNLVVAPTIANAAVLGIAALYVGATGLLTTPPNLLTDLLDYYWHQHIQEPTGGGTAPRAYEVDLRSARRIRGEERRLLFQITNRDLVNSLEFGLATRMLLKRS